MDAPSRTGTENRLHEATRARGSHRPHALGDQVRQGPRLRRRQSQAEAGQAGPGVHVQAHQGDSSEGDGRPGPLPGPGPFAHEPGGDAHGHEHLHLRHQGREPRRQAQPDPGEQQPELQHEHGQGVLGQVPERQARPRHNQHQGHSGAGEPESREEHGRHVPHAPADGHVVEPPRHHRAERQQKMRYGHGASAEEGQGKFSSDPAKRALPAVDVPILRYISFAIHTDYPYCGYLICRSPA